MKRFLVAAAVAVASLVGFAGTASAAGQLCHSVTINVNGESLVSNAQCNALP